ncbi:MAG: glycosyltransferase family 4 protein [Peptococcaceae bacterium]|nr:glycosyltransferase family 4 protein [Peptococcaceae bacterium]
MKIGIFTDSYRPYTSGVVHSIDLFTRDLTSLGHEVNIFAPSYPKYEKDSRVFRFASLPAPTNPGYCLAIPFSLRLKPAMKRLRPDIIHVHSPFMLGRLGAKYARNLGVPLVFTFHTLYDLYTHYMPFGQNLAREITRRYYREFCNVCDLVITPTGIIAEHLRSNGVTTRIETVPTGIDIESFKPGYERYAHQKHGLPEDCRVLLCVGRLGQEKNHKFILDVYARILPGHPDTRLVLVGGGPEESNLKNRARELGVMENVIFTGTLDRQEVVKYYCSAYLFVFASVTETQGLVLGEAKAAGVPSVAVRAFGVSEMVKSGEDGFLTENSMDDFALKLDLLLRDGELRRRMGEAALRNAEALSSKASASKLAGYYEELLAQKVAGGDHASWIKMHSLRL